MGSRVWREYSSNLLALARAKEPYATVDDIDWDSSDFVHVAQEQCRREEVAAAQGSPIVVCDAHAFATRIWLERYIGRRVLWWRVLPRPCHSVREI